MTLIRYAFIVIALAVCAGCSKDREGTSAAPVLAPAPAPWESEVRAREALIMDGQGKSVRIAWSDEAGDRATVDDLIAYLLSL